jgi:hypothetical protein
MPMLGKREGLARKVDMAAIEAESLGLITATLILRLARLEIDRAGPNPMRLKLCRGTTPTASQTDRPEPVN